MCFGYVQEETLGSLKRRESQRQEARKASGRRPEKHRLIQASQTRHAYLQHGGRCSLHAYSSSVGYAYNHEQNLTSFFLVGRSCLLVCGPSPYPQFQCCWRIPSQEPKFVTTSSGNHPRSPNSHNFVGKPSQGSKFAQLRRETSTGTH